MGANLILAMGLTLLLGWTAWGDLRRRDIPNWIVLAIALAAPFWWWANGLALWPDAALRVALAVVVLLVFMAAWLLRMMGGGDVKLLAALALWFAPLPLVDLLLAMAIAGGALTLVTLVLHRRARRTDPVEVPYGIAIAGAAVWVMANQILTIPAG